MSISVIIPTLNEESCIADTLASIRRLNPHETIVVDGGSQDATCEIVSQSLNSKSEVRNSETENRKAPKSDLSIRARSTQPDLDAIIPMLGSGNTNFRLLHSPPGRARQMNLGAAHATGDVLLFLHADCQLENGALEAAELCLCSSKNVAGCFTMHVQACGCLYRLIDACAATRVRFTGLIYGDQGLFLRRDVFQRLRGFPNLRFMEDVCFSRMLAHHGHVAMVAPRIIVSARRWQKAGLIRQTLRNWTLTSLAACGANPDRLSIFYPQIR